MKTGAKDAARDLVRVREDVRGNLMRFRYRTSKLLLQGIVHSGGQAWTGTHELWLARQHFDAPARQLTYESSLEAMHEISDRCDRLDDPIATMAYGSEYTPVIREQSLRGISTLTSFGLTGEIGDWDRSTGTTIGAYLGLVATEHSSGVSSRRCARESRGLVHVDIEKLGRILDGAGHRALGWAAGRGTRRAATEYHHAVDDHSLPISTGPSSGNRSTGPGPVAHVTVLGRTVPLVAEVLGNLRLLRGLEHFFVRPGKSQPGHSRLMPSLPSPALRVLLLIDDLPGHDRSSQRSRS
jgi:hypothetical protein